MPKAHDEQEFRLTDLFYGKLTRAELYGALTGPDLRLEGEIGMTEKVVGGLNGFLKTDQPPEVFLAGIRNWSDASGDPVPAWLTRNFVADVQERMRRLQGEWKALPFGQTMTLRFPPQNK